MANLGSQVVKKIGNIRKNRFEKGLGVFLPEAYKKFWREWKIMRPVAVHYIPEEGRWKKDDVTGEMQPIQNISLPVKFPTETNYGIWGGEGVIKGFQKRHPNKRRVPHFWVPNLKRTVVNSEVLNVYLSIIITDRTLQLIHDHYGFDHYLLKTPACDLQSELALTLKRKILQALNQKCPAYKDDPVKQTEVYDQYKKYLTAYTAEDIEWYGLTWDQAIQKIAMQRYVANTPTPLKHKFRSELLDKMKEAGIAEAQNAQITESSSWISKINPFAKKHET